MRTLRSSEAFFISLFIALFFSTVEGQTPVRIMPLGNSITDGSGSSHDGGYRRDLYDLLRNAGIAFDFVGSRQSGVDLPDRDHEGHPGFLASQLDVQNYLAKYPAEVIFLEIGTNDISYGERADRVRDDIERLVQAIYQAKPRIDLYLATVIPRRRTSAQQQQADALNALLPDLVNAKSAAGYKIHLVDIAARFKAVSNWPAVLMDDDLHPNDAGYAVMANAWFEAYVKPAPLPTNLVFADEFDAGALDENKWLRGKNRGNFAGVTGQVLALNSGADESAWVITRNAYAARNTTVTIRVSQPSDDGNLGISPSYNSASPYGIYEQANWYRFYTYRNANGPYRLYAAWKKNGVDGGRDVTGDLTINGAVYLRLRFDAGMIHFEASLDGATWKETYKETFALPGYTLDSNFYYELAGYNSAANGVFAIDGFYLEAAPGEPDTKPPLINGIAAQNLTPDGAQIIWQTDEPADSQVEYGLTTNYGAISPLEVNLAASHAITISNLQPNTTYHYRIRSKDASGNLAVSSDFTFTTAPPSDIIFADAFNAAGLDGNKWRKGSNAGNKTAVANNALDLKSQGSESGWIITRNAYAGRNTTVTVKVAKPSNDGNLGFSPTYNLASKHGLYDQPNWYRFYIYRNGQSGPYRLYVEWHKNGVGNGFDVTGGLAINGAVYLRLRFDNNKIHFEASLDGVKWTNAYNETFGLPGYSPDTPFYYELAGFNTGFNGVLTVDDFSINRTVTAPDTQPPQKIIFSDDFNGGSLDGAKWQKGANPANKSAVANNALDLKSQGAASGWVITRQAYSARRTTVAVKVAKPNDDGNLGLSPTYNLSSKHGIYDQANWYRFYTYRNSNDEPYRLYAAWRKNGVTNGRDVTGNLIISGAIHLRLRFDDSAIHFEASLDGVNWTNTYSETFNLPGYHLDSPFYYELAGFRTESSGVFTVDDFAISSPAPSGAAKPGSLAGLSEPLPTTFTLQNFPNPFHAATRFKISLPQNAEIRLAVFDMMGREVDDLLAGLQNGGNHEVRWSGRNRAGEALNAGVYFVRLRYRLEGKTQWSQIVHRVMLVR